MARLVALALDRHMRSDGTTTYGIVPTAKAAGVSKETAARWLRSLEEWGWLDVTRRKRGAYWTYRARIPEPDERGAPQRRKRTDTPIRGNGSVLGDRTPRDRSTVLGDRSDRAPGDRSTVLGDRPPGTVSGTPETPVILAYASRSTVLSESSDRPTGQALARRPESRRAGGTPPTPEAPEGAPPMSNEALSNGGAMPGARPDGRSPAGPVEPVTDEYVDRLLSGYQRWNHAARGDPPMPELGRRLQSEHERSGATGRKLLRTVALFWRSDHTYGRTDAPLPDIAIDALREYEEADG